jgi:hypothetical protein
MTVVLWVVAGLAAWTLVSLPVAVVVGRAIGRRPEPEEGPHGAPPGFVLAA